MPALERIRRKIRDVLRYPPLGWGPRDRLALLLLGLVRNRVLRLRIAARRTIVPRLGATRGQRVRVQLDHSGQIDVFDELFLSRIYDMDAVRFDPELVADCGGYCGYFCALAAGVFPRARIACFEANPDNLPMLGAQLALLGSKVELHAAAVSVAGGTAAFSGGGMGGTLVKGGNPGASRQVACIDFPRWLRGQAPGSLVWKLDIEGAEAELMPATLGCLPRKTVCFLETHHPDAACESLLAPYRAAGFAVTEVRRRQAESGDFSYIEWLLTRNA